MRKFFVILLVSLTFIAKSQDTTQINQVLPDSIEIWNENVKAFSYVLFISSYKDSTATHVQTRTVRIEVDPKNIVVRDNKVYYIPTKKDRKK
jgi:hypothetical protein